LILSKIENIAKDILIMKQGELQEQNNVHGLVQAMEGKVWEALIREDQLAAIQQAFKVGNIQYGENGVGVRIVSDQQPTKQAKNVEPNLEDVYLNYFGDLM